MNVERLGIDRSVSAVFPPAELANELADAPVTTRLLDPDEAAGNCEGVVTLAHRETLLETSWVHSIQAGIDRFPADRFRETGTVLTNSTGIHGDAIGETVAGYVLALARRLHDHIADQQRAEWSRPEWDDAWTVAAERACVVGLGGLGRGIVDRLAGLGLDVVGVRRTPTPEPGVRRVYTPGELTEAVSDVRFVVLAVPLTDDTRNLIGESVFDAMRDDAYLINVARGGVVQHSALLEALETGTIAGGALDVFDEEPLPEESPLWEMDDVIVSPHCAAYTRDYHRHVAELVRESIARISAGNDPVNRVL